MKKTIMKSVLGLILAFMLLSIIILHFLNVSLDYWIWLGCPNPIGMLFIENYPGHDFTAEYRHDFMQDKIKVGDSKEKVIKLYRYYDGIDGLDEGYGYIDGSMLTGQTWIEFSYDENDCVSTIEVYSPY